MHSTVRRTLDGGKVLLGSVYFVVRPKQNASAEINGSMGSDQSINQYSYISGMTKRRPTGYNSITNYRKH